MGPEASIGLDFAAQWSPAKKAELIRCDFRPPAPPAAHCQPPWDTQEQGAALQTDNTKLHSQVPPLGTVQPRDKPAASESLHGTLTTVGPGIPVCVCTYCEAIISYRFPHPPYHKPTSQERWPHLPESRINTEVVVVKCQSHRMNVLEVKSP